MAVNIHITIIELNALHTKRQNLFQELDAVIHLLMEAKHWGLRKSRNATSLNSRFKSLDTLKVKIISVTFRRVIRTNHKKASKIWRHENIQLGSFSHSTRNKTRDGLIRVRNIRALNGRFNTSITHAYSIVIGSKHITLNATGGGFLTASKQFRHGATSKSRSNTASNSTKHKSPHLSGWRQII